MTQSECRAFLEAHLSPAVLTFVRSDGRPHASPVWIYPDGDEIVFTMFNLAVKGQELSLGSRITMVVQDEAPPYRYIRLEGEITTIDDDLETVRHWAGKLGGRYLGDDRAEEFAERNGIPGELVARMRLDLLRGVIDITD
jgi:PPOX class probable F420-dependent enzyme